LRPLLPPHFSFEGHYLNEKGLDGATRLLWVLYKVRDEASSVFYLPDLVCLLLHFMSEEEGYCCVVKLLEKPSFVKYFYLDTSFLSPALQGLAQIYVPELGDRVNQLDVDKNFAEHWFSRLFVGLLPFQTTLRIFDCFIAEGIQVSKSQTHYI